MSRSSGKIGGVVELRPSLLAADFSRLAEHAKEALDAGAQALHADVMDGRFVPPITYGADVVKAVIEATGAVTDAHLMIVEPEKQLDVFAEAGVRGITVHVEADKHLHRTLSRIRELGLEAGVALNPATPVVPTLRHVIPLLDRVLIMSVNPGWGGQTFIPQAIDKIRRLRRLLDSSWSKASIQVDGGVSAKNAGDLVRAGVTELVAGTAVFKGDVASNVAALRKAVEAALAV